MKHIKQQTKVLFLIVAIFLITSCSGGGKKHTPNIYVSASSGDNNNSGAITTPLLSLEAAFDLAKDQSSPVTIHLNEGVYSVLSPIVLSTGHSNITVTSIGSIKNTKVIGAEKLSGFNIFSGNIYSVQLEAGLSKVSVYEDENFSTPARYPDSGELSVEDPTKNGGSTPPATSTKIRFGVGEVPSIANTTDLRASIWQPSHWHTSNRRPKITSLNYTSREMTIYDDIENLGGLMSLNPGVEYFLEGALEFVTQPGEHYYDSTSGVLYYYPINSVDNIYLATNDMIFNIDGAEGITFEKIFFGYTAFDPDKKDYEANGAFHILENSSNIKIENCKIINSGSIAILMKGTGHSVLSNEIKNTGLDGINIKGGGPGQANITHDNIIQNNKIINASRKIAYSSPIQLFSASDNLITKNEISGSPRNCMQIAGVPFYTMDPVINGTTVTFENQWQFNNAKNNTISYNIVKDCMTEASDQGGIYLGGVGQFNSVDHNIVYNIGNLNPDRSAQDSIYLDDGSSYTTITNNIVYGSITGQASPNTAATIFVKGIYNIVRNNVFDFTGAYNAVGSWKMLALDQSHHLIFEQNIFYTSDSNRPFFEFRDWQSDRLETMDQNLYYSAGNLHMRFIGLTPSEEVTLNANASWLSPTGQTFDQGSAIGDPLFLDVSSGDYRLDALSPAHALGITEIDTSSIGVDSSYIFN